MLTRFHILDGFGHRLGNLLLIQWLAVLVQILTDCTATSSLPRFLDDGQRDLEAIHVQLLMRVFLLFLVIGFLHFGAAGLSRHRGPTDRFSVL